ncbi:NPCBM/NEW2 domain protein [Rubripirellula lacrimiformis]|uniref:NPCBM/NEW2 domain protein n=1 Tax=Rubripirellula lacrimiformis TaxID=1930273 RepID=A0A517NG42_9BACT|nr:NPCBM/NEW2 domain-containing protein [Rubripirellula lacrimiformis]QDT06096.1 NPCBM/NEW2 domain protein [Rubripirellula lacrimiformis]
MIGIFSAAAAVPGCAAIAWNTSFGWQIVLAILVSVLPIDVTTSSGDRLSGDLRAIKDQSLTIDIEGVDREIPFLDLQSVVPAETEEQTRPRYQVTLLDGSRVAAQDVSLSDAGLDVEPSRQRTIRVPVRQVKSIRFRAAAATTDAQWLGLVQKETRGDVMVIRRPGDKLDPVSGIVEGIADSKVNFTLDGDSVAAPIERLEGVIFGGSNEVADDAQIRITDVYGSVWAVASLQPSMPGEAIRMKLSSGIEHELPLDQMESMRFSSGITLLATEKPAGASMATFFPSKVSSDLTMAFFGPTTSGDSDLQIDGGGRVEYRVASGFEKFSGAVRRSTDVAAVGAVTVRILMDGKTVWEEALPDSQPRGFELDLGETRRLMIQVDSGDDGNLGDRVQIIRPRLLK